MSLLLRLALAASTVAVIAVIGVVAGASCGPGSDNTPVGVDCSAVMPCGGNLVGTWVVRGACALDKRCSGATYDFSQVSTTLTFDSGKLTVTGGGMAKDTLPLSCFGADMGSASCAGLNSLAGYSCQTAGDNCGCTIDYTRINQGVQQMSYLLSGPQVLVGPITYTYCVFGNGHEFRC